MGTPIPAAQHVPRHRHHLASLIRGIARRDQRPAACRRLDDDDGSSQAADQPVSEREVIRQRGDAGAPFAHHPPRRAMAFISSPCSRGYTTSTPEPSTATVGPGPVSAPRCVAASTPRAMPLTTVTPRQPRSDPNCPAAVRAWWDAARDPTIATEQATEHFHPAAHPNDRRWVVDDGQPRRIATVLPGESGHARRRRRREQLQRLRPAGAALRPQS